MHDELHRERENDQQRIRQAEQKAREMEQKWRSTKTELRNLKGESEGLSSRLFSWIEVDASFSVSLLQPPHRCLSQLLEQKIIFLLRQRELSQIST